MDEERQKRLNSMGENILTALCEVEKRTDVTVEEIIHVLASVFWTYIMIHSSPSQIHSNIETAKNILNAGAEEILPQAEDAYWKHYEALHGTGSS